MNVPSKTQAKALVAYLKASNAHGRTADRLQRTRERAHEVGVRLGIQCCQKTKDGWTWYSAETGLFCAPGLREKARVYLNTITGDVELYAAIGRKLGIREDTGVYVA